MAAEDKKYCILLRATLNIAIAKSTLSAVRVKITHFNLVLYGKSTINYFNVPAENTSTLGKLLRLCKNCSQMEFLMDF